MGLIQYFRPKNLTHALTRWSRSTLPAPVNFILLPQHTTAVFFITYKGAKGLDLDQTSIETAFAWAFGLGAGLAILTIFTAIPFMRRKVAEKFNEDGTEKKTVSETLKL